MKWFVVLLTLFCFFQKSRPIGNGCPHPQEYWTRFRDSDRCYNISHIAEKYFGAVNRCLFMDSQLAPVLTCAEQYDLNALLLTHRAKCQGQYCTEFWIGMHRYMSGPKFWITTKHVPLDNKSQCQFWAKGNPNGSDDCVAMSFEDNPKRGVWKNQDCFFKLLKFICVTCPDNFEYYPEVNECLYFNTKKMKWNDARIACTRLKYGAQLLTVKNSEKQTVIENFWKDIVSRHALASGVAACFDGISTPGRPIWTGGQTTNPTVCGTPYAWKPVGLVAQPFEYTNFLPGSPNCGSKDENCIGLATMNNNTYRWDDIKCSETLCSICEF